MTDNPSARSAQKFNQWITEAIVRGANDPPRDMRGRAVAGALAALDRFTEEGPPTANAEMVLNAIMPAALLAALDPEDEALCRLVGEQIEDALSVSDMAGDKFTEHLGSAALIALKALAQGGRHPE